MDRINDIEPVQCPCEKLVSCIQKVDKLNNGIVKTHDACNIMMKEYARLHKTEELFKKIVGICNDKTLNDTDAYSRIQRLCLNNEA